MGLRATLLVLAILAMATAGAGGILLYLHLTDTAWRVALEHTDRTARIAHRQFAFYLEQHQVFSATLAGLPQISAALDRKADAAALAEANAVLDNHCAGLDGSVCYLMDADGLTIGSSNRNTPVSFVGKNYGFRPYFQEAAAGRKAVYLALGVTSRKRGLYFSSPVAGPDGRFAGAVVVKILTERLEQEFANLAGIYALTDPNGIVFASNREDWLFRSLSQLSDQDAEAIMRSRQFGEEKPTSVGLIETRDRRAIAPDGTHYLIGKQELSVPAGWHFTYLFNTAGISTQLGGRIGSVPFEGIFFALFLIVAVIVIILYRNATSEIAMRNRVESELRKSEERLSLHIRNTPIGVIAWDSEFNCTQWNPAAEEIFGFTKEEALGGNALELLVPAELHGQIDSIFEDLMNQRGGTHSINENVTKDGRTITCEWFNTPLAGEDGVSVGVASMVRDITNAMEQERELREAKDRADRASQAKSEFLAMMSHDLRTPLNAIIGFSDMILSETFGPTGHPRYEEYVKDIHDSGTLLLNLINVVLDISKVEAGKFELMEEDVDLRTFLRSSIRMIEPQARDRGVALVFALPDDLPMLHCDPRALSQIVNNLLSNAIKFSKDGGEVTVSAVLEANGGIAVTATDTGVGMSREDIEKALEPFGQADSAKAREYEGTGLGLHVSQLLMDLHGGSLGIDSVPGEGTNVTIRFPAGRTVRRQKTGSAKRPARRKARR